MRRDPSDEEAADIMEQHLKTQESKTEEARANKERAKIEAEALKGTNESLGKAVGKTLGKTLGDTLRQGMGENYDKFLDSRRKAPREAPDGRGNREPDSLVNETAASAGTSETEAEEFSTPGKGTITNETTTTKLAAKDFHELPDEDTETETEVEQPIFPAFFTPCAKGALAERQDAERQDGQRQGGSPMSEDEVEVVPNQSTSASLRPLDEKVAARAITQAENPAPPRIRIQGRGKDLSRMRKEKPTTKHSMLKGVHEVQSRLKDEKIKQLAKAIKTMQQERDSLALALQQERDSWQLWEGRCRSAEEDHMDHIRELNEAIGEKQAQVLELIAEAEETLEPNHPCRGLLNQMYSLLASE